MRREEAAFSAVVSPATSSLCFLERSGFDPERFVPHHLELDERDVVWSASAYDDVSPSSSSSSSSSASSPSAVATDNGSSASHFVSRSVDLVRCPPASLLRRPFPPERPGLFAALAEEEVPLVRQRRPAARATRPVTMPAGRTGNMTAAAQAHHQSAPVNIAEWRKGWKGEVFNGLEGGEGSNGTNGEEEEEMVPPHVMVARSQAMASSVFEGVGRTLKGRDLRRVRNAVLQKTGFLDL